VSPTGTFKGYCTYTKLLDALVATGFADNFLILLCDWEECIYKVIADFAVKLITRHS
jgi:hypothetical protein